MKLAIVGTGMIVKELLPVLKNIAGIELQMLISTPRSLEQAQQLSQQYGISQASCDYQQALCSPLVDCVYIATPNHLHYQYAQQALLAGKHVICEKPFTLTGSELDQLIACAKQQKCLLLEAITNLHLPNFALIQQHLAQLGELKIVQCNYSQYSSRYDAFKCGEISPVFDAKQGGGALRDLNIYNIHLLVGLFGLPQRVEYMANMARGVDTSGILLLDYGNFKGICIGAKDSSAALSSVFQGDNGSLTIYGATNCLPQIAIELRNQPPMQLNQNHAAHRMHDEFVVFEQIIRNADFARAEKLLAHSRAVMQVLDQAVASLN